MADNQIVTPYDDNGWPGNASRSAPITLGGTTVVKAGPGRLCKVAVTATTGSAAVTIYDNAAGAASGTVLLVIPSGTAPAAPFDVQLPVFSGITVVSAGATGNITVGYS